MALVDHLSLPCPHHLLEDEIHFLTTAFACLDVKELTRPVPSVVGLGRGMPDNKIVEDDGTNNAFLWVFSDAAPGATPLGEGQAVSSIHLALKAQSKSSE